MKSQRFETQTPAEVHPAQLPLNRNAVAANTECTHASRIGRWIGVAATAFGCSLAPVSTHALELLGDKCEFTAEELADPDKVLTLTLAGDRYCTGVYVREDLYGKVVLPRVGKWAKVHPEKAIASLLRRYGVPRHEPFEPWGGTFREFRVLESHERSPIEGHAAQEYLVELLYVNLIGWQHVPRTGRYGIVPVCERNRVSVVVIEFGGKWYVNKPPGIGSSTAYGIKTTKNRNWDQRSIERDLAEDQRVSDMCKDRLN